MGNCQKREIDRSNFPRWFRAESGFKFTDGDGDRVIVIGEGGWRNAELIPMNQLTFGGGAVYDLKFNPVGLLGAYNRKGEWHLCDLSRKTPDYWIGARPGWVDARD